MDYREATIRAICTELAAGSAVVLVSIVDSDGSAPRHNGASMVVGTKGLLYGTVGGGMMEAGALAQCKLILKEKRPRFMDVDLEGENASAKGPICGGTVKLLLDCLEPAEEDVAFFKAYQDLVSKGKDFYFVTVLGPEEAGIRVGGRALLSHDGTVIAGYGWREEDLQAIKAELHNVSSAAVLPLGKDTVVVDSIRKTKTLYCFGAGHVAVPTVRVAALAGFQVTVIDDRADYASAERFPEATGVVVIKDFARAIEGLSIDADSFIVIVTRGHSHDHVVLEQALRTTAGYIGMIGSRRKRDAIYAALSEQGVSSEQIKRVHCPIGLPISAETPEEIAVSIVAELVAERAKQQA